MTASGQLKLCHRLRALTKVNKSNWFLFYIPFVSWKNTTYSCHVGMFIKTGLRTTWNKPYSHSRCTVLDLTSEGIIWYDHATKSRVEVQCTCYGCGQEDAVLQSTDCWFSGAARMKKAAVLNLACVRLHGYHWPLKERGSTSVTGFATVQIWERHTWVRVRHWAFCEKVQHYVLCVPSLRWLFSIRSGSLICSFHYIHTPYQIFSQGFKQWIYFSFRAERLFTRQLVYM